MFYGKTRFFAKANIRIAKRDAAKRRHEQKAEERNMALRERANAIKEKEKVCTTTSQLNKF